MKYFFFDIDGTLHSPSLGVCKRTVEAIQQLKQQGHFIAVATGRSFVGCRDILLQTGIEYAIVDGGHQGFDNGCSIFNEPIDLDICKEMIEEAMHLGIAIGISDDTTCYLLDETLVEKMSREHEWMKLKIVDTLPVDTIFIKKVFVDMQDREVSLFNSFTRINHLYLPKSDLVVTDQDHKLQGIQKMLAHVNYNQGDIIVFGDSRNDLAMFAGATISICMQNGVEETKNKADYVTDDIDNDGVYKACKHFNWI